MSEVTLDDAPNEEELKAYRARLDRARGSRDRPVGPPRKGMPAFADIDALKHEVAPQEGDPTMTTGRLEELTRSPDPTPSLSVPGLRRETVDGLRGLADHVQKEAPPAKVEEVDPEEPDTAEEDHEEQIAAMLEARHESPVRRIFNSKRKKELEASLPPIDLADLLMNQDARQKVPLTGGVSVTFRSLNGHENMFVLSYIWEKFHGNLTNDMHELARGLVGLVMSVVAVGDRPLTEHRDDNGKVSSAAFAKKWDELLKYPSFMLEAMDVNRAWFLERCSQALSMESVGNG